MNRIPFLAAAAIVFAATSCGRLPEEAAAPSTTGSENPFQSTDDKKSVDIAGVVVNSDNTVVRPSGAPSGPEASIDSGPATADTTPATTPTTSAPTSPQEQTPSSATPITPKPVPKEDPVVPDGGKPTKSSSNGTHTVASGETLSTIAQKYGASMRRLQELNSLTDADVIVEGQRLKIPA